MTIPEDREAEAAPIFVRPVRAAAMVGLGRSKLLELVYRGEIPSTTVGRTRLIPVGGLRDWADRQLAGVDR